MFPSYLHVPLSQVAGEAGPWHKERGVKERRKKHLGLWPTHGAGGGPPWRRGWTISEPESTPVGRAGKEGAAPAATQ